MRRRGPLCRSLLTWPFSPVFTKMSEVRSRVPKEQKEGKEGSAGVHYGMHRLQVALREHVADIIAVLKGGTGHLAITQELRDK